MEVNQQEEREEEKEEEEDQAIWKNPVRWRVWKEKSWMRRIGK